MARVKSIEAMRVGLAEAILQNDWTKAARYIERLKGIIIDGVAQDDPNAIRLAGHVLQQSGERLELVADLQMTPGLSALAWQLRADTVTAALASRVRPSRHEPGPGEEAGDVRELLMLTLRQSNRPMSNRELSIRLDKDPATVSRGLQRLERDGQIRRRRANGRQLNAPVEPAVRAFDGGNTFPAFRKQRPEIDDLKLANSQAAPPTPILSHGRPIAALENVDTAKTGDILLATP